MKEIGLLSCSRAANPLGAGDAGLRLPVFPEPLSGAPDPVRFVAHP